MGNYHLAGIDKSPAARSESPAAPINPWLAGLDPHRLARVRETQRLLGHTGEPPDPVAAQVAAMDAAAREAAERARFAAAVQWDTARSAALDSTAEQRQAARKAIAAVESDQAKVAAERRQNARKKAEMEQRRAARKAVVAGGKAEQRITAIRQEIEAILGVSRS